MTCQVTPLYWKDRQFIFEEKVTDVQKFPMHVLRRNPGCSSQLGWTKHSPATTGWAPGNMSDIKLRSFAHQTGFTLCQGVLLPWAPDGPTTPSAIPFVLEIGFWFECHDRTRCSADVGRAIPVWRVAQLPCDMFCFPQTVWPHWRASSVTLQARCSIEVVAGASGIAPVNFHTTYLLWRVHVHFDCAGSRKMLAAGYVYGMSCRLHTKWLLCNVHVRFACAGSRQMPCPGYVSATFPLNFFTNWLLWNVHVQFPLCRLAPSVLPGLGIGLPPQHHPPSIIFLLLLNIHIIIIIIIVVVVVVVVVIVIIIIIITMIMASSSKL